MFNRKPSAEEQRLNDAINMLLDEMSTEEGHTERYASLCEQLSKLVALRDEKKSKKGPSTDTLILAATNLIGIAIIVGYERTNVVTSKAVNFLPKLH